LLAIMLHIYCMCVCPMAKQSLFSDRLTEAHRRSRRSVVFLNLGFICVNCFCAAMEGHILARGEAKDEICYILEYNYHDINTVG
jgi:hypothetical protein